VYYYMREVKTTDVVARYARDIKEGWWDRRIFKFGLLGLSVGTTALCIVMGLALGTTGVYIALAAAAIHPGMYVFVLCSSTNGLCPQVGYTNFANTATNPRLPAPLPGGEGLHNNHHGYPRSRKFRWGASELDPPWPVINLLVAIKRAKPYKTIEQV